MMYQVFQLQKIYSMKNLIALVCVLTNLVFAGNIPFEDEISSLNGEAALMGDIDDPMSKALYGLDLSVKYFILYKKIPWRREACLKNLGEHNLITVDPFLSDLGLRPGTKPSSISDPKLRLEVEKRIREHEERMELIKYAEVVKECAEDMLDKISIIAKEDLDESVSLEYIEKMQATIRSGFQYPSMIDVILQSVEK